MRSQNNNGGNRKFSYASNPGERSSQGSTYNRDEGYGNYDDRSGRNNRYPEDTRGYDDYDRSRSYASYRNDNSYDRPYDGPAGRRRYGQHQNRNNYNDVTGRSYGSDRPEYGLNSGSYNGNPGRRYNSDDNNEYDYRNQGYGGRNASDYTTSQYEDDNYYYNPADDYENGRYRYAESNNNSNRYNSGRNAGRDADSSYGYYESYPPSGQRASYNDHERYNGKDGKGYKSYVDTYGEVGYRENNHRNIRDNRSY